MNIDKFWEIIDQAWLDSPSLHKKRALALQNNDPKLLEQLSDEMSDEILDNFTERLYQLSEKDLTAFIHILEERLYNIDREEIQEYTDGSDDGFLYCRCFILGMGKEYYDLIDKNPSKATADVEAEIFGFIAYSTFEDMFDKDFVRNSKHCIESGSNKSAWN
jgi:Protein of unknown function (DUF4240)